MDLTTGGLRMKHKALLIIGGGILQEQTLYQAYEMGLKSVIADADPECYCSKSPMFNMEYFIKASIKDPDEVLKQVKRFESNNPFLEFVGVYTQGCDAEYTVAYVAERLGLPSIGYVKAHLCNNKIEMRQVFKDARIPQPEFCVDGIGSLKIPLVVKPADNCASRGVTIVRNGVDMFNAVKQAQKNSLDLRILYEEFIDGEEYSVDTVLYNGHLFPCGISDRVFEKKDNYAIQNGSITPTALPKEKQDEIYILMERCARAIGIEWGAFKGDVIIDKSGKVEILEVTARLSGGFDSQFRKPYSFGMNLIKATIDMAVGNKFDVIDVTPKFVRHSQTFTIFPKPGVLNRIIGLEETRNIPGVMNVFITKKMGDTIKFTNCADRVCHIITCADSREELASIKEKVEKTLRFET